MGNISSSKGFSSSAVVGEDIQAFFIAGSDPAELEQQLTLSLAQVFAGGRAVIDLSLGGAGKGNAFVITVTTGEEATGPDELYWAVFGASSEDELVNAAAAAKQRLLAQAEEVYFVGQTIVGGAHGEPFCGLLLGGGPR